MNKIIIFNQNKLQGYQIISIVGLLPYLMMGFYYKSAIGVTVFFNGLFYWTTLSNFFRYLDVLCNMFIIIFVNNFTLYQPETFYYTLIGISSWSLNYYNDYNIKSSLFHIIMVQSILGYGVWHYIAQ